jgi:hypothetical protein
MLRLHSRRFVSLLALVLASSSAAAEAQSPVYHYVALDQAPLPAGIDSFSPVSISDGGRIYGELYGVPSYAGLYQNGAFTVIARGSVFVGNKAGTGGGSVPVDAVGTDEHAALFHGTQVELIPPQPGEISSVVESLSDSGTALVSSIDAAGAHHLFLYTNGGSSPVNLPASLGIPSLLDLDSQGNVSGTVLQEASATYRGFRFDPHAGALTLLSPAPPDPHSFALAPSNHDSVLGYSFDFGGKQTIGLWNKNGIFTPYFTEGTPQIPATSSSLLINDDNLVVVTRTTDHASYVMPRPNARIDLSTLVDHPPAVPDPFYFVSGINNHGDLVGSGFQGNTFLLERTSGSCL